MGKIGTFPTKYYHTSFLNDLAVQMGQTELMGEKKKKHRKDENILKNSRETSNQKVIV